MKPTCIFYGNCQTVEFVHLFSRLPQVAYSFQVEGILSYDPAPPPMDFIGRCGLFIEQVGQWTEPPAFENHLPPGCIRLRFPAMAFQALWPFHGRDPRYDNGRYDIGDTLAVRLSHQGLTRERLYRRYLETEIKEVVDLDRFWEIAAARLREIDKRVDVPMFEYVEAAFRKEWLFWAYNHPTHLMMLRIGEAILGRLGGGSVPDYVKDEFLRRPTLGGVQRPIHPQVLSHFGIEWANENTLYHIRDTREQGWFTFNEFLWRYITRGAPF